jgi:hypothetical protein
MGLASAQQGDVELNRVMWSRSAKSSAFLQNFVKKTALNSGDSGKSQSAHRNCERTCANPVSKRELHRHVGLLTSRERESRGMKFGQRVMAMPPIRRRDFISRAQFRSLVKHTCALRPRALAPSRDRLCARVYALALTPPWIPRSRRACPRSAQAGQPRTTFVT